MLCPHCQTPVATSFWTFPKSKPTCSNCGTKLKLVLPPGSRLGYYTLVYLFMFLFLLFLAPGIFTIVYILKQGALAPPWPHPLAWLASAFIFMLLGRWLIGQFKVNRGEYLKIEQAPKGWRTFVSKIPNELAGLAAGLILAFPVFAIWGFNKQITLLASAACWGPDRTQAQSELCLKSASFALMTGADPNYGFFEEVGADGLPASFPTPLNVALGVKHWAMVLLLLDQGADVNSHRDGDYPIMKTLDDPSVFDLFLEHGARTDVIDLMGRNVLWHAALLPVKKTILRLIDLGNDPNHPDRNGITPFHMVCIYSDLNIVEAVIRRGGDLRHRDHRGHTAAHHAARNKDVRVLRLLSKNGVDLNEADWSGSTPLHTASAYGRWDTMEFLLQQGVSVNPVDVNGATPLDNAVKTGDKKAVRLLLDHGANPNLADRFGWGPLHEAAGGSDPGIRDSRKLDPELVALLLEHKANVHARALAPESVKAKMAQGKQDPAPQPATASQPVRDWTPLHAAAQAGFVEGARLLIRAGADPNVMTLDHRTPLSLAREHQHLEMMALLLGRGALEDFGAPKAQ